MNGKCPLKQTNISSSLQEQKTQNKLKLKDVEGAYHCPLCKLMILRCPKELVVYGCEEMS
jgi:hypothetical protein